MLITLKQKKLKDGKISLFLEYYKGSSIDDSGKRLHLRDFEYLKIYLLENPKTPSEKKENKENQKLADSILAIRKAEYVQGKFNIRNTAKDKRRFLDYFSEKTEEKINSVNNYGNWTSTLAHLKKIVPTNLLFEEIDENFIKKVKNYIDNIARTKSDLPLSLNSKYSYFNKFKACLRSAFDEGYLPINYAAKVKSFEQSESQREYLTHQELQNLANMRF